ncbi:hypothetical protein V5O48_013863 [Marasmius crinis-equi]|uniref:Uncharacterized protein n=1 Tax=Marasmius crinis-equi TaxID=585013 RepID=A0ABR3EZ17_9AGAR
MATTRGMPPRIQPKSLQNELTSKSAGTAESPIALSSSPGTPTPVLRGGRVRKRANSAEMLTVTSSPSSRASSPIPSPTRRKRLHISPSPSETSLSRASSPATDAATPQPPVRPDYVAASSPIRSSQPRSVSAPPESPVRRASGEGRGDRKCAESPGSSESAEEILAALEDLGSSPVKAKPKTSRPQKSSSTKKRKAEVMDWVEISTSRKRARNGDLLGSKRGSSLRAASKSKEGKKEVQLLVSVPSGAPDYVQKALELFSILEMGPQSDRWSSVVEAWLLLEMRQKYRETAKLTAVDRPEVISKWIGQARWPTYKLSPPIDVENMRKNFQDWWRACVPEW